MCSVIAIGGLTCSGKTTLAEKLRKEFDHELQGKIRVINQDDYFFPDEELVIIPELNHPNFDRTDAVDWDKLIDDLRQSTKTCKLVLIDGHMIFSHEPLNQLFDRRYFVTMTYDQCKAIRDQRTYEPPDVPGFFEDYVWPAGMEFLDQAQTLHTPVKQLQVDDYDKNFALICTDIRKLLGADWLLLTETKLDVQQIIDFITEPTDGALSIFCGITRATFEGKAVTELQYEAYDKMAYAELRKLCNMVRSKWSAVDRIAIHHRLGLVPVSEHSVIIACSSCHRAEAQAATSFAIDHLKAHVPIWKKEIYADNSSTWKENQMPLPNAEASFES